MARNVVSRALAAATHVWTMGGHVLLFPSRLSRVGLLVCRAVLTGTGPGTGTGTGVCGHVCGAGAAGRSVFSFVVFESRSFDRDPRATSPPRQLETRVPKIRRRERRVPPKSVTAPIGILQMICTVQ